jgi:hypothetical protein
MKNSEKIVTKMSLAKAITLIQSQCGINSSVSGMEFVTTFGVNSSFNVDISSFGSFYMDILGLTDQEVKDYIKNIQSDTFNPVKYGLPFCEKLTNHSPIIIDMMFEFIDLDAHIFYDSNFIMGVVKELQEIIMSFISIPMGEFQADPEILRCFVLETPIWRAGDKQYQSLRFQFPYTRVPNDIINGFVIKELVIALMEKDFIRKMTKTPTVTDWSIIVQKLHDFISMYGSKKFEHSAPLLLRSIFSLIIEYDVNDNIDNERDTPYYIDYEMCETINPLECSLISIGLLNIDDLSFNDKICNLPLILSVHFCAKFSQIIPGSIQMGDEILPQPFIASIAGSMQEEDQVTMFNSLMPMVSLDRFNLEHKYYWYTFGKVLYNIYNCSSIGYNIFLEYSSVELKDLCAATWETFGNEYYDIRIIMEFAQADSPQKFKLWHTEYCKPIVNQAKGGADMIVAELVKRMLILEFIFDREAGLWYYKRRGSLQKDIGALEFKNVISTRLKVPYYEMKETYERERDHAPTPDQKRIYKGLISEVEKFIAKLDDGAYLDKVIRAARGKMYDDNFTSLKDENLSVMSCTNCVIETYDKTIAYRPFMIQDYITKNTDIAFPISYNNMTPQVLYLIRYYAQVFVESDVWNTNGSHSSLCRSIFCGGNPELRLCYGELCHHILKCQASILKGGNEDKQFTNLIGPPNRSKSKYVEIKEKSLGRYCVDLPGECITIVKGKQSGAADPAIEQAKGGRLFNVKETSKHEPIDVSKVKKWTGNDRYYNRTLHKEGGSRNISGKLWHMSNVMGDEPNADEGYNIRKVIIPFDAEFTENPPYDELQQYIQKKFKMNESFSKKIPSLAQADLYLMYSFYDIYTTEGIKIQPRVVVETTERQKNSSDAYYNFIKEKVVIYSNEITKERDYSRSIGVFDLFVQYTRWYKTFAPSSFLSINQNDFRDEMLKMNRLGPLNEINQWPGVGLRTVNNTQQAGPGGGGGYALKPQVAAGNAFMNQHSNQNKDQPLFQPVNGMPIAQAYSQPIYTPPQQQNHHIEVASHIPLFNGQPMLHGTQYNGGILSSNSYMNLQQGQQHVQPVI